MTTQLVSIRKGGNSFIYLSQTPTVPMQMYPSNFKESSGEIPAYQRQNEVSEDDERENNLQRLNNSVINELLKLSRTQQDKNGIC